MARKSRKNLPQPEQAAASVLLPELEEAKMPAAIYGRLSVEDDEKEESGCGIEEMDESYIGVYCKENLHMI